MPRARLIILLFASIVLTTSLALAQSADCPAIVEQALDSADQLCQTLGRNQACYGNLQLAAVPQPDASDFRFDHAGDIVNVALIQSLHLSPLDELSGVWGVALMKLQANLPDTLPGQNVTFLLFGDVEITSALTPESDPALRPMQAFFLRTGLSDSRCEEAPESGLLVQTPEGAGQVAFTVNGVEVSVGSTVFFQAQPEGDMTVSTLEGSAFVTANGFTQPIIPGTWARIPLNRDLRPTGSPELPASYAKRVTILRALPLRLLEREIQAAPPLSADDLAALHRRISAGGLLCDGDLLPACARFERPPSTPGCALPPGPNDPPRSAADARPLCLLPASASISDGRDCVFRPRPGDPPLPSTETRPFCPDPLPVDDRPCVFQPGPGDPPLPSTERRPFCPEPQPPAPDSIVPSLPGPPPISLPGG